MSSNMPVDLFESEGNQVVPDALFFAPLSKRVQLMEIKSIALKISPNEVWISNM